MEETGIAKTTLYRHFASKRDLYLACLDHAWQSFREEAQAAASATELLERRTGYAFDWMWGASDAEARYDAAANAAAAGHLDQAIEQLEQGIAAIIRHHDLPWHVVRVGLRAEIVSAAEHPRNGTEALLFAHSEAEHAMHLYCLNRGVIITPFHNMMLVCPETEKADVARLFDALDGAMAEISGRLPMRPSATH